MNSKYRCTGCKIRFKNPVLLVSPAGTFHSVDCATAYSIEKSNKIRAKAKALDKKTTAEGKRKYKREDIRHQHTLTRMAFNKMRRLQELKWYADRGLPPRCISCQGLLGGDQWCCGHFKTTHNSLLRYDERNTFLQHNRRCNKELSGDIAGTHNTMGYRKGLIVRFGKEEGQKILDYCDSSNTVKRWTWQELEANRKQYNKVIREIENENHL